MIENPETGALENFDMDQFRHHVPELKRFNFNIDAITFESPIDSSDMEPHYWVKIAKMIEDNYDNYNGFVVLHGTDTMSYTASALSFMLENLGKPVIVTGSQLPIGKLRTDGKENLLTSIEIAAARNAQGEPMVPEVCIFFQSALMRGNRTTKINAEGFNAFRSYNFPPLAKAGITSNTKRISYVTLTRQNLSKYITCLTIMWSSLRFSPAFVKKWWTSFLK
jgi:L-asparaginase